MQTSWVSFPPSWKLQDVQAVLNVIINALSVLGIYIFARMCWLGGARQVVKHRNVELYALTSLNTIGEAPDVLCLLKSRILSSRYLKLLAQCFVVPSLSTTALLSGPIARFSTRRSHMVTQVEVNGTLATNKHNAILYTNML